MRPNAYFLDLPIYRLAEDDYYAKRDAYVQRRMGKPLKELRKTDPVLADLFSQSYGGAWRYNEIIGYIRLYFQSRDQVRGEHYATDASVVRRSRTKNFVWKHWKLADEQYVSSTMTSAEIFSVITNYVNKCRKELPKSRYIDTEVFEKIGPYIDWQALLQRRKQD